MALILSIDTSIDTASVCLAQNGNLIGCETNTEPKQHGSFIQKAIASLFSISKIEINELDAVSVANGPGSYTGLRVGLASAKGLCFALNKPLILINTLELLARATINRAALNNTEVSDYLFCPMIDARRLEVFTAVYNHQLENIIKPSALVLDSNALSEQLNEHKVFFSGNGSPKFKSLTKSQNADFITIEEMDKIEALSAMSEALFTNNKNNNLAYSEPFYIKDVFFAEKSKL